MLRTFRQRLTILLIALAVLAMASVATTLLLPTAEAQQQNSVPDQPTGLASAASHDSVILTWNDPQDSTIDGYMILRRLRHDDPSGQFDTHVADTGTPTATYTDDDVQPQTHYTYRIKAINEHGESERSRWLHVYTPRRAPAGQAHRPDRPSSRPRPRGPRMG